ncbi:MAG: hypothetical protein DRP85_06420 [Candidatus Makaraimicrobium thalassicum]|nr:MAG: hypothetical protein DRP85_06420 [Candidatus Omnitrophota bacterium]
MAIDLFAGLRTAAQESFDLVMEQNLRARQARVEEEARKRQIGEEEERNAVIRGFLKEAEEKGKEEAKGEESGRRLSPLNENITRAEGLARKIEQARKFTWIEESLPPAGLHDWTEDKLHNPEELKLVVPISANKDPSCSCIVALQAVMSHYGFGGAEEWEEGEKAVVAWFIARYEQDGLMVDVDA